MKYVRLWFSLLHQHRILISVIRGWSRRRNSGPSHKYHLNLARLSDDVKGNSGNSRVLREWSGCAGLVYRQVVDAKKGRKGRVIKRFCYSPLQDNRFQTNDCFINHSRYISSVYCTVSSRYAAAGDNLGEAQEDFDEFRGIRNILRRRSP